MIRNKNVLAYTETDKNNLCVRKFSVEELEENRKKYNKSRNKQRLINIIILVLIGVFCLGLKDIDAGFFADLALVFWIFVVCISEIIGRIDSKANVREYYVEIRIMQKLPQETESSGSMGNRTQLCSFPVIGTDTTTNYESKFYIEREDYIFKEVGDIIRIKNKSEELL